MGMAASQARLLSITSRMSDNELRSQLINNAKMRLTTDSSKASEKYLAALNEAQMMFSNYDTAGNSQYQQLTFSNLTSYSAYNNQYGLVNKSGQLLISENDASKYTEALDKAKADPDVDVNDPDSVNSKALEEFLKSYGLEKTTTYFDNSEITSIDPNIKKIYEGDMEFEYGVDANGMPKADRISGIHYGYDESLKTKDYGIYKSLLDDYSSAKQNWKAVSKQAEQAYVKNLSSTGGDYEKVYQDAIEWANSLEPQYDDNGNITGYLRNNNGYAMSDAVTDAMSYMSYMEQFYNNVGNKWLDPNGANKAFHDTMKWYFSLSSQLSSGQSTYSAPSQAYKREGYNPTLSPVYKKNALGIPTTEIDHYEYTISVDDQIKYPTSSDKYPDKDTGLTDADGNPITVPVLEIQEQKITQEEFVQSVADMYRFFQSEVLSQLNPEDPTFRAMYVQQAGKNKTGDEKTTAENQAGEKYDKALKTYKEASEKLSLFIFGKDVGSASYDKLDDMEWILYGDYVDSTDPSKGRTNNPAGPTTAIDTSEGGITYDLTFKIPNSLEDKDLPYRANFQVVKDIYLSEKMIEKYGAPKYTWIDKNNPDENAEKKAAWYTNLFNRINEGGYQALETGLAHSAEWIKFALESGLVSMEQVDVKKQWISTMYSNCSNITESQVDVDITVAEAEYNKTMNEIEAKDKRYDIELKNIDTEHQSLQTEYETIKSVIDKNVERNFKMFQA